MKLNLKRPICFIDLETTGVSLSTDRIVEIAMVKIMTDGSKLAKRKLLNPQIPIPQSATDIHGINDAMVKDAPTFKQAANEIKQFIDGCDLGGYNSNRFDIPMLMEEFLRSEMDLDLSKQKMVDVQHIFYVMEPRTLSAAYKFFAIENWKMPIVPKQILTQQLKYWKLSLTAIPNWAILPKAFLK